MENEEIKDNNLIQSDLTNITDEQLDELFDEIIEDETLNNDEKSTKPVQAYIDLSSLEEKKTKDDAEVSNKKAQSVWSSIKYKKTDASESTEEGSSAVEETTKKEKSEVLNKLKVNGIAVSKKAGTALSSMKLKTVHMAGKMKTVVKEKTENSEALDKLKESSKAAISKISTTMSEKKAEKQELKPEKIVLAPGEEKVFKLFFVSDMEEEATYLHQMSTQGKHFVKKAGMQYVFHTGEAHNYYYHLGYYEKDKRDGDRYTFNYEEAGWEKIYSEKGEFNGMWNYFRTEVEEDAPAPEIFSDRISRIALYERLLSSWRSLLAMIVICLICMAVFLIVLNSKVGKISSAVLIMCILVSIAFVLIFAIYGRIYLKVNKKLVNLKK